MKKAEFIALHDVKWSTQENIDQSNVSQHAYYSSDRTDNNAGKYTGETHKGNSALCNKNWGISEDGDFYVPLTDIQSEDINHNIACKRCIAIYNTLLPF